MNLEDRATDSVEQRGKPLHLGIELHLRGLLGWGIQRIRTSPPLGEVDVNSSSVNSSSVLKTEAPATSNGSLEQQAATVAGCRDCDLCETRNLTAFGVGDASADLLLVGDAPGEEEDRCGEPFVGPAGQLLDRMIAALGLSRDRVYITNVLKCRPPQNRQPPTSGSGGVSGLSGGTDRPVETDHDRSSGASRSLLVHRPGDSSGEYEGAGPYLARNPRGGHLPPCFSAGSAAVQGRLLARSAASHRDSGLDPASSPLLKTRPSLWGGNSIS